MVTSKSIVSTRNKLEHYFNVVFLIHSFLVLTVLLPLSSSYLQFRWQVEAHARLPQRPLQFVDCWDLVCAHAPGESAQSWAHDLLDHWVPGRSPKYGIFTIMEVSNLNNLRFCWTCDPYSELIWSNKMLITALPIPSHFCNSV